jgi:hypothetical protein
VSNSQPTDSGLLAMKRAYLRTAVEYLKQTHGLRQRQIAEGVGDNEQAFSARLKPGGRGIPDSFIDAFAEKYGIPFGMALGANPGTVASDPNDRLNLTLSELEEIRLQLRTLTRLVHTLIDLVEKR